MNRQYGWFLRCFLLQRFFALVALATCVCAIGKGPFAYLQQMKPSHVGSVELTPAPLNEKCDYFVRQSGWFFNSTGRYEFVFDFYKYEKNLRLEEIYEDKSDAMMIIKPLGDIFLAHTYWSKAGPTCFTENMTEEEYNKTIDVEVGPLLKTSTFDSVEDGSFGGKDCKVYRRKETDGETIYYVDDDDYIFGVETNTSVMTSQTVLTYAFHIRETAFVMYSRFHGCDESAYFPPEEGLCDGSSFVAVSNVLLFMAIIIAVYSLF